MLKQHQVQTVELIRREPRVFDMSDPGTGKTLSALTGFVERRKRGGGKALVVAPRSILQSAWGDDTDKFCPGVTYMPARASNRKKALSMDVDIYITNHDAATWLAKNQPPSYWKKFDTLIIDESTAFKHQSSQRSKAMRKLAKNFEYREVMTGTPNPNGICDLWHQVLLLDDGQRLGKSFWAFRSAVCEPKQIGPMPNHLEWKDKEGIEAVVYDLISDITIRHKFEDCNDIPPNHQYNVAFHMPPKLAAHYKRMMDDAVLQVSTGTLTQVSASAVNNKLLQIASGAVYTGEDQYELLDSSRYELVMDLVEERKECVVPFVWRHQRECLVEEAKRRGMTYAVIDGSIHSDHIRNETVKSFQRGEIKVLFVHPQSAGHGLTLTRGTATIFASPTANAEHYKQVFHRIYRMGQTEKTETINVLAADTLDEHVFHNTLNPKLSSMQLLLDLAEAA